MGMQGARVQRVLQTGTMPYCPTHALPIVLRMPFLPSYAFPTPSPVLTNFRLSSDAPSVLLTSDCSLLSYAFPSYRPTHPIRCLRY
eukprot:3938772-Rhodomonas_salina.1